MSSGKIFISYRREDTSGESGRLKDKLEQVFGQENIFYDVETLEAGLNFDQSIAKALSESKVLLAMIGPHWLKVTDSKGTLRLQKSDDWVRKEISEALKRNLRVIPVLVNGAEMPDQGELPDDLSELSLKHAQELSSSRWNYDVGELSKVLEKIIAKKPEPKPQVQPRPNPAPFTTPVAAPKGWWAKNYLWVLGGVVTFFILVGMCVPETDESYIPYDSNEVSSDLSASESTPLIDSSIFSGTVGEPDFEGSETQVSEQFIPDLSGQWNLYLNGQKVSVFAFNQSGANVAYYEYDLLDVRTAEGQGAIDGSDLLMDYYNSTLNVNANISMSTDNSGQTWTGTIYFPATATSGQIVLARN